MPAKGKSKTLNLASDLEAAAGLLTKLKANYPSDCEERRLLLLAKDASFFVYLNQIEFMDFQEKAENGLTSEQSERLKKMGVDLD
jgi:hypothetical protein